MAVADPSGNPVHLLAVEGYPLTEGAPPEVFNMSLRVADLSAAEDFFAGLGFGVHTREFLPETLVFRRHGAIPLVLHRMTVRADAEIERGGLVLAVPDLGAERARWTASGREIDEVGKSIGGGPSLMLHEPSGSGIRILERAP
jgi:hypothetical protein